jgi:hypothetical protein
MELPFELAAQELAFQSQTEFLIEAALVQA